MGYRACLGIIRLAEKYSPERMEAAAERAVLTGACRYQSVKSMLQKSLDRQPLPEPPTRRHCLRRARQHARRGVLRVRRASMLQQPMMEKLMAMRLHGMVEALQAQKQDRAHAS